MVFSTEKDIGNFSWIFLTLSVFFYIFESVDSILTTLLCLIKIWKIYLNLARYSLIPIWDRVKFDIHTQTTWKFKMSTKCKILYYTNEKNVYWSSSFDAIFLAITFKDSFESVSIK